MEKSEMEAIRKDLAIKSFELKNLYIFLLLVAIHIGCIVTFWVLAHLWYDGDKKPIARLIIGAPAMENFYLEDIATSFFKTPYNKRVGANVTFILHYTIFFWLIIWKPLRSRLLGLIVALYIQALLLGLSLQEIPLLISTIS